MGYRHAMGHGDPLSAMDPQQLSYGADASGLICGYLFSPTSPGMRH